MKWWDFSDKAFLTFAIISLVLLVLAIFVIITFSLSSSLEHKDLKKYKDGSLTTRVYVIDVKKNVVTYFNIGGRTGIRTQARFDPSSGFRNRPLQPLGYSSSECYYNTSNFMCGLLEKKF